MDYDTQDPVSANELLTGVPTNTPAVGFTRDPAPVTNTVDDNDGNTTSTASVTIDFVVQPPTAGNDALNGLVTNTPVIVNVLANDNHPDGNLDPASVQITCATGPGNSLLVPGEGNWSIDATIGEITFTPEAGFTSGPTPVTYTVSDNDGNLSNTASVTLDYDPQPQVLQPDGITGVTPADNGHNHPGFGGVTNTVNSRYPGSQGFSSGEGYRGTISTDPTDICAWFYIDTVTSNRTQLNEF